MPPSIIPCERYSLLAEMRYSPVHPQTSEFAANGNSERIGIDCAFLCQTYVGSPRNVCREKHSAPALLLCNFPPDTRARISKQPASETPKRDLVWKSRVYGFEGRNRDSLHYKCAKNRDGRDPGYCNAICGTQYALNLLNNHTTITLFCQGRKKVEKPSPYDLPNLVLRSQFIHGNFIFFAVSPNMHIQLLPNSRM